MLSLSLPDVSSDSLGIGIRSSTLDFMNSSDSFSGIVLSSSFPIMRESSGSRIEDMGALSSNTVLAHRQTVPVVDNHNRSENRSHITHTSMSRTGALEVGRSGSGFAAGSIRAEEVTDAGLEEIYVPEWTMTKGFKLNDVRSCANMIDHFTHLAFFKTIRGMEHE
ncbi:hypothetical protein Tco_1313302 [Tanacetum coccineum]